MDDKTIAWGRADSWFFVDDLAHQLRAASDLLLLMHEIAEDSYCESWSDATAMSLWRVALDPEAQPEERGGFGYDQTERAEAHRLVELCRQAGCWWTWDEATKNVAMVPLTEWVEQHGKPSWWPKSEAA
jgi:hypothetical protein